MKYHIKQSGPAISDSHLRSLEQELGRALPNEYRDFLLQTNGGSCGDLEFERENGVIDSIKVFYGLLGKTETGDLLWSRKLLEDRIDTERFLAIAHTPIGDVIILDLETGGVFFWIHDTEDGIEILAEGFRDFWRSLKKPASEAPECDFVNWRSYSPNWRGKYGHSVVEAAAIAGRADVVREWIEAGLSPGDAMRCSAMNGHLDIVDLLTRNGVELNQVCSDGRTPLDWALWNPKYAAGLRDRGAKTSKELKSK